MVALTNGPRVRTAHDNIVLAVPVAICLREFVGPIGTFAVMVVHGRERHGVAAVASEAACFRPVPHRFVGFVVAIDVHVVEPRTE